MLASYNMFCVFNSYYFPTNNTFYFFHNIYYNLWFIKVSIINSKLPIRRMEVKDSGVSPLT